MPLAITLLDSCRSANCWPRCAAGASGCTTPRSVDVASLHVRRLEGPRRLRRRHPRRRRLPRDLAILKRQFPNAGMVDRRAHARPDRHARGDAHGRQRVGARAARDGRARSRAAAGRAHGGRPDRRAARRSPSSAPRAASAARPSRSTSRPPSAAPPASRRCWSTCTWRTATPRSSSASSRASRCSTRSRTSTASTRPTSRAWSPPTPVGPDLLASSDRALLGSIDVQRVRQLVEFATDGLSATSCSTARAPTPAVLDALDAASTRGHRRQPGAGRRCATPAGSPRRCASATARPRQAGDQPLRHRRRDRPRTTSSGCSAAPVKYTFPSDYRAAVGGAQPGEPLILAEPQQARGQLRRVRARRWPGCRPSRAGARSKPGCSAG